MTFHISPSGINSFYTCPAQFRYNQQWQSIAPTAQHLLNGTHAHKAMEGTVDPDASKQAMRYFKQLYEMEKKMNYEVLYREVRQKIPLGDDIILVRVIDAIVMLNGVPTLVDYKTSAWPWPRLASGIAPKGSGFQPAAYLVPPTELPEELDEWPTQILFLVASQKEPYHSKIGESKQEIHTYNFNEEDDVNLMRAIMYIKEVSEYVKVKGHACGFCDFKTMCFKEEGFEMEYREKKKYGA